MQPGYVEFFETETVKSELYALDIRLNYEVIARNGDRADSIHSQNHYRRLLLRGSYQPPCASTRF